MKITFTFIAIIIGILSVTNCSGGADRIQCTVTNPLNNSRENEPIVVKFSDIKKEISDYAGGNVAVYEKDTQICLQQDDIDGDGIWDELVFLTNLNPQETKTFTIQVNLPADFKPMECAKEMHAQMFLINREDRSINPSAEISSDKDNMYNRLHHHGPAWESDKIAYRLYFDKKTTVDVYGKKKYRLELDAAKFYPSAEQLADNFGDDILWVGTSVGVGTFKGWNGTEATHIDPMNKRTAKIVINGPIRTIVDMAVEGWQYQERSVDVTARYIQYARHRDMTTQVLLDEATAQSDILFSTGVQKVRQSQTSIDQDGMIALWGTEFPTPDSVKYAKETFGLGIVVPNENIVEYTSDPINHLVVIKPNKKPVIEYAIAAAALKEEEGFKTADEFFNYMKDLKQLVRNPITIQFNKL